VAPFVAPLLLLSGALFIWLRGGGEEDGATGAVPQGSILDDWFPAPAATADDVKPGNVAAFLAMIRAAEGTAGPDGYRMHFGGSLFDSFEDHPRLVVTVQTSKGPILSSAAGAYQILARTWDQTIQPRLHLPDFSPASQDLAAVQLMRMDGSFMALQDGRFDTAVALASSTWASLPGAPYGQPTRSIEYVSNKYTEAGGQIA
jgi:lysozyme